jgi:hypothetical protein
MPNQRFSAPDLSDAVLEKVGPYQLALVHRNVGTDGGPTLHVFGPVAGADTEILRFDCFRKAPHYHLGISYRDTPVQPIEHQEPLAWVLSELSERFPDYLARAEAGNELPDNWGQTATSAD